MSSLNNQIPQAPLLFVTHTILNDEISMKITPLALEKTFPTQTDPAGIHPLPLMFFLPLWNMEARMETEQPHRNANTSCCRRKLKLPLG